MAIAKPWLETPIDYETIKNKTTKIIAIFSSNDLYVPLNENRIVFEESLNARTFVEKNKGHLGGSDGVNELPVVLHELLKMLK
ncbi:hypothetical protein EPN83_01355 [Patescibacteria group bacterium]|nr:MAG: hypothetical protein EPN83_01355 [Patescibacteria group bacterium]